MFGVFAAFLSIVMVITSFPACSKSHATETSKWSVRLRTSGGFGGKGKGNVFIASDGKVLYERMIMPGKATRPCNSKLSKEEMV